MQGRKKRKNAFIRTFRPDAAALLIFSLSIAISALLSRSKTQEIFSLKKQRNVGDRVILAACHGKRDTLPFALESWTQVRDVDRILFVYWGSLREFQDVSHLLQLKSRKIETRHVTTEIPFILTVAYNIGIDFVAEDDLVLKVDCDTLVDPHFFRMNMDIDFDSKFYAGNWKMASNENELHLNGLFVMKKSMFTSVGGYDERIQGYGWDDSDLYIRLQSRGYTQAPLSVRSLRHLPHGESSRCTMLSHCNSSNFQTQYNRLLTKKVDPWSPTCIRSVYSVDGRGAVKLKRLTASAESILSSEDKVDAAREAAKALLWDRLKIWNLTSIQTTYLIELANLASLLRFSGDKLLIMHVMHGLGNRLRALASALALAKLHNMKIVLVWPWDEHMKAEFTSLFVQPRDVHHVVQSLQVDYDESMFQSYVKVYDYMDEKVKNSYISFEGSRFFYVRSAYILNAQGLQDDLINDALRGLVPSVKVQGIMSAIKLPKQCNLMLGVHIRAASISEETYNLPKDAYSKEGRKYIEEFRSATRDAVPLFVLQAKAILEKNPRMVMYLSTDIDIDPLLLAGVPHAQLKIPCKSRELRCIQIALADLLLLGESEVLLGSYWSSFSEVAGRIAGVDVIYPFDYHTAKHDVMEELSKGF